MANIIKIPNQPNLMNGVNLKRFKGCYRLVGFTAKIDRYDNPYWAVRLSDIHNSVTAYMFTMPDNLKALHHGVMIQCEVSVKHYQQKKYLHVAYLEKANNQLAIEKSGLMSLPCALTPDKKILSEFCSMVNSIHSDALKNFIAEVLMPSDICLGYIQAPASLNYHHNYSGGLISHSVEVAQIVATMPWKNEINRDLAITAALLHDIGKIKTLSAQMKRTEIGRWVDHDALTIEVCAKALSTLEKGNETSAILLRHIWTCASPGARYGYKAATPIANAVQNADRLSAEMDKPSQKLLCYR
ncbi:MAG: HD domain-containing protein [Colwellia sp.]